MAEMSICRSRCGRSCWQPQWIICSASFLPKWAAWRNISWKIRGQCNPPPPKYGYSSRNISMSIHHSNLEMDRALPPHSLLGGKGLLPFILVWQLQQSMITKWNNGNITLLTTQLKWHDNNRPLAMQKTGLPMRYYFTHSVFTTVHKNTPFLGQGRSWHLANLLYHVLRVSYYSCLARKIILYCSKNTHISDIFQVYALFLGDSPMCLMS